MKLYFFDDAFDNVVHEARARVVTWDELCGPSMFGEHRIATQKNDLAFILADFDTDPATCRPATWPNGDIKQDVEGAVLASRVTENIVAYHGLVLDYDNADLEATLEKLVDLNLKHLGYTSWSHRLPGKGDRFRIILPFVEPCPRAEWDVRKGGFNELFEGTDRSGYSHTHIFYTPACAAENAHLAHTWNVDGAEFDWRWVEAAAPIVPKVVDRSKLVNHGNGPVVWESFDAVQFFKDQGLYVRPAGGHKHDVTCPNGHHTDGGTVVWQDNVTYPTFYCAHTKCASFKVWQHFKEKLGAGWQRPWCQRKQDATMGLAEFLAANK